MNLNLNIYGLEDLGNKLNLYKKETGFDFLFIPLQLNTDIKVYNLILEKLFHQENFFNDSKIIKEVNNNIDILYCIFANFHFSRYHISAYFSSPEHNNSMVFPGSSSSPSQASVSHAQAGSYPSAPVSSAEGQACLFQTMG